MQTVSDLAAASRVWNDPGESLESVNRRIHDGIPLDLLAARSQSYVDRIFGLFPYARPKDGASILEIGSGVGYIMQAMEEGIRSRGITPGKIIGLDIAEHMIARAEDRLYGNSIFSFLHYDGLHVPLPNCSLDLIYSVASLQHVPRPYVFNMIFEILRLLKPDGYAVIQLLSVKHLRSDGGVIPWRKEIQNQVSRTTWHWHHYYSVEELEAVLWVTGFGHFDVRDDGLIWALVQPGKLTVPADFDPASYLAINRDVAEVGGDPVTHWLEYGHREGRTWSRHALRSTSRATPAPRYDSRQSATG